MEKNGGARCVLIKLFYGGALLLFGWFFLAGICSVQAKPLYLLPFGLLTLSLVALALFLTRRFGPRITDKLFWRLTLCVLAGLALLQLAAAYFLAVEPSWDFGGVYLSAYEYVTRGKVITHENYFARFPNNTGLLLWEIACFKVLKFLGVTAPFFYGVAGILMNLFVIDVSILFTVLFCRRTWGNARAVLVLALCVLFTPYILYSPIFYTDSMSLLFITLPLYLFSLYLGQERKGPRLVLAVSIGLLLAFGTKVKGSVAILLVALLLYAFFNFGLKRAACLALALAIPFAGFSVLFDRQVRRMGIIREEQASVFQFPTEYWFYMGLKSPGGFNQEDFDYIYSLEDTEARKEAAREGIAQRLSDYGPLGLLDHLTKKAAFTFSDGTYFIGVQLMRKPVRTTALSPWFLAGTKDFQPYQAAADAYHILILLLLLLGLALELRAKRGFGLTTLLYVTLFGVFLFLMMWETRSRYLLNFTPLMLILAADALSRAGDFFHSHWRRRRPVPADKLPADKLSADRTSADGAPAGGSRYHLQNGEGDSNGNDG